METMTATETLLSIALGLGLSAACGFRVFVPLLVMSVAGQTGYLALSDGFAWIASTPATVAFAAATLLEVGAYYIPIVDNFLDSLTTPAAVVAGILATASQVSEMDPLLGWTVAIIGGGGIAGAVQGMTSVTRHASALTTAGFGNPVVSTLEGGAALVVSLLSIVVPLVAVALVLGLLYFAFGRLFRRFFGPAEAGT